MIELTLSHSKEGSSIICYTLLIDFIFFLLLLLLLLFPPNTKFAMTLQKSRELITCVDQHKIHNSFNITSLMAKKTELAMAIDETIIVKTFGSVGIKNNQ
jgi:hypothetical protein